MAVDDSPSPPDSRIATPDLFASGSDTPWLARKDWASGELRYNAGVKPGLFVGCIGLILLILAFPFAAILPHSIRAYGSHMLIPLLMTIFATSMAKSYLLDAGLWSAANKEPACA
jgi:hypothetical protein